jgi:translation initiation factor IF-1
MVSGCGGVVLPGTMFRVELDNKHLVLATILRKDKTLGSSPSAIA